MRMKRVLIERMRLLALVAVVFALTSANAQKVTFAGTVLTLDEYKGQAVDNDTPATRPTGVTGFVLNQDYEPIANAN